MNDFEKKLTAEEYKLLKLLEAEMPVFRQIPASVRAVEYLNKFAPESPYAPFYNRARGHFILYYMFDYFCDETFEHLIDFYYALKEMDQNLADEMLKYYVNTPMFTESFCKSYVAEEYAEKVFAIPFRNELINLFGRVAIRMTHSLDPDMKVKALEIIEKIKSSYILVPDNIGVIHSCDVCYSRNLIYDGINPLEGLQAFWDMEQTKNLFKYVKLTFEYYLSRKDYKTAFDVLTGAFPEYYWEEKETDNESLDGHQDCIFSLFSTMTGDKADVSQFDWIALLKKQLPHYAPDTAYLNRAAMFFQKMKQPALEMEVAKLY